MPLALVRQPSAGLFAGPKCVAPAVRGLRPRPRLFECLASAGEARITWIAAPAGSGKTSVLASWLHAQASPWLWYQVDDADADPASFFVALTEAAGPAGLPRYDASCEKRLRAFSRQFAAALVARHGGALRVAVDDFHAAPDPARLAGVLRDMAAGAPGLRLLVASRLSPPATLSRMRMHGELSMLAWPELRLTMQEAGELLDLDAAPAATERLAQLHRASDGWAAGLLLLARREHWPEAGLPADAPERGLLDEYLTQEVLGHATPAQRRALTASALLPAFDAARLRDLLGEGDPDELLRQFQALPFFVRREDPSGSTWTHHPLIREFLLGRFALEFAADEADLLRRRAARLLLAHGDIDPGLRLLHEHAAPADVATALLQHAPAWLAQGRAASLEAWIARLPAALVAHDPWLALWLGKARTPRSPAAAIEPLERAADRFRSQGDRRGCLLACAAIAEAVGYGYAELKRLAPWLAEAARLVPAIETLLAPEERAEVMGALFAALVAGQRPHPDLAAWREQALRLAETASDPTLRAKVLFAATMSHVWAGDYAAATRLGDLLREVLAAPGVGALPLTSGWLVLSVLAGNHPGPVADYADVEAGLRAARETGVHVWDAELHGQAAVIALCHDDRARAATALAAMLRALPPGASVHSAGYHCFAAWRSLLAGEPGPASESASVAARDAAAAGSEPLIRHAAVMAAQAAIALDRADDAERHLAVLAAAEERTANPRARFVRLLLEAERDRLAGRLDEACEHLRPALALGRDAGYVAYYGWLPGTMASLALLALRRGIEVDYVRMLVGRRALRPTDPALDVGAWPWPIRITTFGAWRVDGLPQPAKAGVRTAHKPLELVLALVAAGGRDVAEATLCDALWPDAEGDAARSALDVTLHRVRRLLGDANAVTLAAGRLGLDGSRIWVDVRAIEPLLQRSADSAPAAIADLDALLALYRGPFLRDVEAPWAVPARARLRRRFVAAVTQRLRLLVELGLREEALSRALRACEAEPDEAALTALAVRIEATRDAHGAPAAG
jgi:ATP/maltotriose-dependent transcriptional regulator MalT